MASSADKVDLSQPRYNLDTYIGRLQHFYTVTSPLTLFAPRATLLEAQTNVRKAEELIKDGGGRGVWVSPETREKYWNERQLVESSIHPDTGLPVPVLFRMSAFVPTNLIICAGMLTPNPSMRTLIFWQWANQSLNVAVNYNNANKSIALSTSELLTAYTAATATSVLIAISLSRLVPRIPDRIVGQAGKELLAKFVPFASVASAGVVNISCIRWKEIKEGINVFRLKQSVVSQQDSASASTVTEKEDLGKSSVAGQRAVMQSAASRVICNVPTLIFPPILMTFLAARGAFKGPRAAILENLTQLTAIGLCLYVFLPPSIAVFPQRASVPLGKLEPHLRKLGDKEEIVYFNKGL